MPTTTTVNLKTGPDESAKALDRSTTSTGLPVGAVWLEQSFDQAVQPTYTETTPDRGFSEAAAPSRQGIDPLTDIANSIRVAARDFVYQNLAQQTQIGFAAPVPKDADLSGVLYSVTQGVALLGQIYDMIGERSDIAIAYRSTVTEVYSSLEEFLLHNLSLASSGTIDQSEIPSVVHHCIVLEKGMAKVIDNLAALRRASPGY